jgi:hypothetical protein
MDTHWEEKNDDRRQYFGEALHAWIPGEALADGYIMKSVCLMLRLEIYGIDSGT